MLSAAEDYVMSQNMQPRPSRSSRPSVAFPTHVLSQDGFNSSFGRLAYGEKTLQIYHIPKIVFHTFHLLFPTKEL